jgi:hypothetical protein
MKKHIGIALAFLGSSLAFAATTRAAEPLDVYFEAKATRGSSVVIEPHVLVKMGRDAEVSVPSKEPGGARMTVKYTLRPAVEEGALVIFTGLVDGRIVASGTLDLPRAGKRTVLLQGGGLSWSVTAVWATPELLGRKKS